MSELNRTGNVKPPLSQSLRHPHEAGTFAGVRLVPIVVGTLSSLFMLSLRLRTGRRLRVLLPNRGLRSSPHGRRVAISPGPALGLYLVLVLVLLVRASVSSSFALRLILALALSLRITLAFFAMALHSGTSNASLGSLFSLADKRCLW